MKQIYANNFTTLQLGRKGENLARQVVFDIRDLESLYGSGTVEVIYQRPGDAQPYPLAVQRDGTLATWDVTATDTEMSNAYGKCELRYYVGETLAKSKIWRTWVEPAMDTPSETAPPEPEQGWVDQIISVGAAAKASADAAKADADRAAALAAQAAEKAAQTAQDASDAAKAMEAAQTAQRLAEEAQSAAEAARTAAAAAQAAAEKVATDAAGAKQDAETAQKAAQDAATAAANALESIQTLYQEMQTWAQGVIQDVNAAGSAAVQSVQSAGDTQVQRVTDEGATQTSNAKAQADAAAQSASGAAQSAQQAAESAAVYDDVVADVNRLKKDVAAITPDDTVVDGKPWTSKKIVDTICQPIEESGNHVQVYPVENYPLGVKVSWEPTQAGEGEPNPDNIRPITGRDAVQVTRCGKNLLDMSKCVAAVPDQAYGLTVTIDGDTIHISGVPSIRRDLPNAMFRVFRINQNALLANKNNLKMTTFDANDEIKPISIGSDRYFVIQTPLYEGQEKDCTFRVMMSYDTPTAYEPYTGSTTDIALQETVYGGEMDAVSGESNRTWRTITLTGEEASHIYTNLFYLDLYKDSSFVIEKPANSTTGKSSHYKYQLYAKDCIGVTMDGGAIVYSSNGKYPISDEGIQEWKAYLAAQYAAGTPVQICYKLAEPVPFTATGTQPIHALSGVNTLYTDADGVVVTGAEDPKHTITELKNAIISLGGNI